MCTTIQEIIANNIRREITRQGLKQRHVATEAGIGEQAFSNMLCGRKAILVQHLPVIANALGVTINDLFKTDP